MFRRTVLLALLASLPGAPLLAQSSLDKVTHREDGKLVTETGETKGSPRGVTLVFGGGNPKTINAQDIVRVEYGSLPGVQLAELAQAQGIDASPDAQKAQAAFAELVTKAANAPVKTKAFVAFREAMAAARVADAKTGPEFATAAKPVLERLLAAGKLAAADWETWPAHRAAARIQGELGDNAGAAATLKALAATPGLTKEQKQEALLAAAGYQARAGDAGAKETLAEVEQEGVADALKDKFAVLKTAGTPGLKAAVDAATDPAAKGVGYTLLGTMQEKENKPREAIWSYLWTEAVYTDDPDATIAALRRLVTLFEKQGDKERAEQFRDRLPRARADG